MPKPERETPQYNEWDIKDYSRKEMDYLGTASYGVPYFHHADSSTIYEGSVDDTKEQIRLREDTAHEIEPGKTLGETIESIGEQTGWESLSEFAQEHLPDKENN